MEFSLKFLGTPIFQKRLLLAHTIFQTTVMKIFEDWFVLLFSFKRIHISKRSRENRSNITYSSPSFPPTHIHWTPRSSHKSCSIKPKFSRKHLFRTLFFSKFSGLRRATFLIKRFRHRCVPVNFAKFLRTLFYRTFPGDCFCTSASYFL